MNNKQQQGTTKAQSIEKDYINNMLNVNCLDTAEHETRPEIIDFNAPYKNAEIECNIFNIAGLNIAVPVSNISSVLHQQIIVLNDNNSSPSGICTGKIDHNKQVVDVIDLVNLVMSGANDFEPTAKSEQDLADIVLLKGCSLGFIYNGEIKNQTILNEQVCWRDTASERVWLAGTVAQMGLALLDVEGVVNLLHTPV